MVINPIVGVSGFPVKRWDEFIPNIRSGSTLAHIVGIDMLPWAPGGCRSPFSTAPGVKKRIGWGCWVPYGWWFRNRAWKPVEVGSLSHYLQGFSTIPGGWPWDFWTINSIANLSFWTKRVVLRFLFMNKIRCDCLKTFKVNHGWVQTSILPPINLLDTWIFLFVCLFVCLFVFLFVCVPVFVCIYRILPS